MPRSYKRTPKQQEAYRASLKKQEEDLKKRKAEAKAKAAEARPKKINIPRKNQKVDY